MSYTLYGTSLSPYVRKVLVACAEKDIEIESVPINPMDPPADFVRRSPLGKIPLLVDSSVEELAIADSSVICDYLEQREPQRPLVPSDPVQRARTLWLEEYTDSGFVPAIGPGVFQAVVVAQLRGEEPRIEEANRCLQEQAPRFLDYFESELGDREFFVGDDVTLADLAIASPFVNLVHAGAALPAERWPNLARFVETMHGRPSFAHWIEAESSFRRPVELSWG